MNKPVHVIVDGGLDDALALAVLVGLDIPLAQVIATEGSRDMATNAIATRRLMVTLGSTASVRLGSDRGLVGAYAPGCDPMHGEDAFGGKASRVTEVIWMGGAVAIGGNMTAAAEFNAWMDPPAAIVAEDADIAEVTARILRAVASIA